MSFTLKALQFLRLVDPHDGRLSLTAIALQVALVAATAAPGPWTLGALLAALAAYAHKRAVNTRALENDVLAKQTAETLANLGQRLSDSEGRISELRGWATKADNRVAMGTKR